MEQASPDTVEFRWDGFDPDDPHADEALYRLREQGADAAFPADGQHGIAFIPIIIGAIAVFGLAKAIKSFIDDMKVGMVIDARGDQIKVTKDKSLGRGNVLLISKDGSLRLENPDADKLGDLIKGVVGGLR
jgi:hypothetical protein